MGNMFRFGSHVPRGRPLWAGSRVAAGLAGAFWAGPAGLGSGVGLVSVGGFAGKVMVVCVRWPA